jgi:aminopeptidase-like protein
MQEDTMQDDGTSLPVIVGVAPGRLEPDLSEDGGKAMHRLISDLYPICRSITGEGVRRTLNCIREYIPIQVREVPTGLQVLDWTIPSEWNIRGAFIKNSAGDIVVDMRQSNLHVVGYSVPVHARMRLSELKAHLHSDPAHPDWIPYRTTYYQETWGFCLPHSQLEALPDDDYEVFIDSSLERGHLTYGELLIPGHSSDEILVSCHVCHPSLCNDNLSGIAVATALAQRLKQAKEARYSYRFLFIPGTIGSIAWLALNRPRVGKIKHGFVLTCVGDRGHPTYKCSRRGDAEIDRVWTYVLKQDGGAFEIRPFSPFGYDERQFCSPGFDLAIGCFMRTPHGQYSEYHTSADNIAFVHPKSLKDSLDKAFTAIDVLNHNERLVNQKPYGEPRLGKYGLYGSLGGLPPGEAQMALLWILNKADGENTLLDIAVQGNLRWDAVKAAARALIDVELLKPVDKPASRSRTSMAKRR